MRAQDKKVPISQLLAAVEGVLETGPRTIGAIAQELGYSVVAVRARLEQLELEQRAHRVKVPINSFSGFAFQWRHGAAANDACPPPAALAQQRPGLADQGVVPFQSTVRTFPAINRRDPLVAALFGPPGPATA